MTIDKYVVNSQTTIHGDTADIALQVTAAGISVQDAKTAEDAFDQFIGQISGKVKKTYEHIAIPYSAEEVDVVRNAPDKSTAWAYFRQAFPKSHRTRDAIRKKWLELHPEVVIAEGSSPAVTPPPKESVAKTMPSEEKPAATDKKTEQPDSRGIRKGTRILGVRGSSHKGMKYGQRGIPFSSVNDRARYQQAVKLCKKHGCTYPEALKKEAEAAATTEEGAPEKNTAAVKPPAPVVTKKEPVVPVAAKKVLHTSGVLSNPPVKKEPVLKCPDIVKDMRVKYTGSRLLFTGIGTVKRINQLNGMVLVDINNGLEWIPGNDLAPAAAAGGA